MLSSQPSLSLAANRWSFGQFLSLVRAVPAIRRSVKHQAFDASFDPEQLAEARTWRRSFQLSSLPEGSTSFSRSSGPGGQHVNKCVPWPSLLAAWFEYACSTPSIADLARTETKATTTWSVPQLLGVLPTLLHSGLRESKYYSRRNDCLSIQAQTQRSRSANAEENHQKLFEELEELYRKTVPGETGPDKAKKYEAL